MIQYTSYTHAIYTHAHIQYSSGIVPGLICDDP